MKAPSDLLERWIKHIQRGRALDIGAGEGEVVLWLASEGFKVDAIERDPEASKRLREECAELEVNIHTMDVRDYDFPEQVYSLLYAGAVLHFIKPTDLWQLADRIVSSLAAGGFFIAEVFITDDPGFTALRSTGAVEIEPNTFIPPSAEDPMHYFMPGELERTFSSLVIQEYTEARRLDPADEWGFRSGASIVARKV